MAKQLDDSTGSFVRSARVSLNRRDISMMVNRESGQPENDLDSLAGESSNTGSASLVSAIAALNCGK